MAAFMKASGVMAICMAGENTFGLMDSSIRETITWI